jgi:hypothetical protein
MSGNAQLAALGDEAVASGLMGFGGDISRVAPFATGGGFNFAQLAPMLSGLQGMGGMQQQQMQGMAAPRITPGRDINVLEPILSLFANQAPNQRPVRRMSLL